jgi:hypothetical protein
MAEEPDDLPLKALRRTSVLGGALALGFASRRYKGAPAAIAKSLGDRLAEVLPADEYTVSVEGPVLEVTGAPANSSVGVPGLLLLERGTPEEKLTRVYAEWAESLGGMIAAAHRQSPAATAMRRARFPGTFFDPHVLVSDETIDVWWGGADPEEALVRLRPIPRSEIGL